MKSPKNPTHSYLGIIAITTLAALSALNAKAQDVYWQGGTDDYNTPADWVSGAVPGSTNNADNDSGTNNVVEINSGDPAWSVQDIRAGNEDGDSGAFVQSGSTVDIGGSLRLGVGIGSTGLYTLNSGVLNGGPTNITVGESGVGLLNIYGGALNFPNGVEFGVADGPGGSAGTVNQTNGAVNCSAQLWVGNNAGTGVYNLSGGTLTVSNWLAVGRGGAVGTLNLSGNGALSVAGGAGNLDIGTSGGISGVAGTGALIQTGGAITNTASQTWLGEGTSGEAAAGTWNISAGTAQLGQLNVGYSGTGTSTLNISGTGAITCAGYVDISLAPGTTGNVNIGSASQPGGSLTAEGDLTVGDLGTGTINLVTNGGGVLTVHGTLYLSRGSATAFGSVNLNSGGTIITGYLNNGWGFGNNLTNNPQSFNFNGGTLQASVGSPYFIQPYVNAVVQSGGAIINDGGYAITVLAGLTNGGGGGGLTKLGSGTLYLDGANTYTGDTLVSSGALGGTGSFAGPVTVASGATLLADTGNIQTLHINNTLTLQAGSTTFMSLTPSNNDQIAGLTGVTYGGTLALTNTSGTSLTIGSVYQLFNSSTPGISNFSSVTILPYAAGSFNPTNGTLTIIPTPSPIANWPSNQLLPTFPTAATNVGCIDLSSASNPQIALFTSLEGIVNRTQPRLVVSYQQGDYNWISIHNIAYTMVTGYNAILQYRSSLNGLVVNDTNQPDTLNLATTIAGVKNELICDPSLLSTLTNAPYNLPIVDDLRGQFATKYQVYGYLYTNYWPQCTHRILAGLETNLYGYLRDYLVAAKVATVWLDPGTVSQDATTMALFTSQMTPVNGVYIGWVPNEGNDVPWLATYGLPVVASDFYDNGSIYSGIPCPINVPPIPPPPPLQNKVYVALVLSDGDNAQYMAGAMKDNWENSARGSVPIGWTAEPLVADLDPAMLNYFWSTATSNDCLISGPSGAGYARVEHWSSANLALFTVAADRYLQRSGMRVITVWDSVNSTIAQTYATNCPSLLGITDQNGTYSAVNLGLRCIAETPTYASTTNAMISAITSAASRWNGTAPIFIVAQADAWDLVPSDLLNIANSFSTTEYQFVRPDHLFMLYNQTFAAPVAVTQSAIPIPAGSARLAGLVSANATNTLAWLEWGTNSNYGSQSVATNLSKAGSSYVTVSTLVTGLNPHQTYHYQIVASNFMGESWGGDKIFTTGGELAAWGSGTLGQTNLPPDLTNVVGISCGANHALAVKNDGTVAAWGYDSLGQTNVPAGLSSAIAVAGGIQHSLALLSNGTVTAWGDNTHNQTNVPSGLTNAVAIAAGGYFSLALLSNQTVVAWGDNTYGQTNVPTSLSNVVSVAAGYGHGLALMANGTVSAWGETNFGQTNVPAGLTNVVGITAGQFHSVALKANGASASGLVPASRWVADSLSGSNGAPVSNWMDTVNGKSASQSASGNQPQLYSKVLNGHNTVRFSSASSQFLTVSAAQSPISGAGDFTMVVVFRTSTPGNASSAFYDNTGLLGADQPGTTTDWSFVINGTDLGAGLGAGSSGCSADVSLYGGYVTDGNPHIGAYVRSGGTIRLYVDGAIVAEQNALCTAARGSDPFDIGAMTTAPYYFNGDIAEIQLYSRALNSWEMANLNGVLANTYGLSGIAGAPVTEWVADSLSGANDSSVGTWTDILGGRTATQTILNSKPDLILNDMNGHSALRFTSAAHQFLTVSAVQSPISGAGSFTMILVFKTATAGASSSSFYDNTGLLGADVSGVVADWSFVLNGSQLGAGLGAGAGECGSDYSLYGGNVTDGNPHIGMYVRSGATISLYVDGTLVASQGGLCADARVDCLFEIGAMTTGSYYFNGDIAEIEIYDRALSSWEIMNANEVLSATYGVSNAASQAGTVVVWGDNANNQANVPPGLTNVLSVASGNNSAFNLALVENGAVTGWGSGSSGQTTPPAGMTNVAAIAAGASFGLAIGSQPPVASNITVSGYVNHDLTVALPGFSPDGIPLNFSVLSLPAAGALYQYSGGAPGTPITATNTAVTDPQGRVVFAPGSGATGNPYATFNFMANDGFYNSGSAQATVIIGLPATPQFTGVLWNPGNPGSENFTLNFSGASNASYSVWATTNLVNWQNVGTATEAQPGMYEFIDAAVTSWPERFYYISAP